MPHPLLIVPPDASSRGGVPDLCPEVPPSHGISQRLMEAPGIGRIYERGVRPLLTAAVRGPRYADEDAWMARWMRPVDGPLLDLACGTGRYSRWLARRFGPERVIGADLSWPMLQRAAEEAPGVSFVRASAQALPLPDARLGGACCMGALHLFPDPPGALAELGRALRPGAPLVILTAARPDAATAPLLHAIGRAIRLRFLPQEDIDAGLQRGKLTLQSSQDHGAMRLLAATRSA